jgi:hypothetical protein
MTQCTSSLHGHKRNTRIFSTYAFSFNLNAQFTVCSLSTDEFRVAQVRPCFTSFLLTVDENFPSGNVQRCPLMSYSCFPYAMFFAFLSSSMFSYFIHNSDAALLVVQTSHPTAHKCSCCWKEMHYKLFRTNVDINEEHHLVHVCKSVCQPLSRIPLLVLHCGLSKNSILVNKKLR